MSRIVIIGAGAVGSFLGLRLHASGHEVLLIARGDRLAALRTNGVLLSQGGELLQVHVPVSTACDPGMTPDHVIIATKTFQLDAALALLKPLRTSRFTLLTVQNGIEAPGIAQAALPHAAVLGSRMHGFFELEEGIVHHTGVAASLMVGPVGIPQPRRTGETIAQAQLVEGLVASFIPTALVSDIRPVLWDKFLMAATIGGVAPAFELKVGQVLTDPQANALLVAAMHEVARIAAAHGVELPRDCVGQKLDFIRRFPPDVTSSLQRDLEAGRPSEFAQLTGAITRFALQAGLPSPASYEIVTRLRARGLRLA